MKCVFLIAQFCMFYEKSYIDRYVRLMLAQIRLCGICKETSQSLTGRLPETTGELYGRALSVLYYVPSALCLHPSAMSCFWQSFRFSVRWVSKIPSRLKRRSITTSKNLKNCWILSAISSWKWFEPDIVRIEQICLTQVYSILIMRKYSMQSLSEITK